MISIITGAISAISAAVSNIGPAVSSFCTTVLPKIVPVIQEIGAVIKAIANGIFSIFGIIRPGEDVEEMGDRALQAADKGIKPENYETYDEYLDEIRGFELDPEKSASRNAAEKISAGIAIGTVGLEKKLDLPNGTLATIWLLAASKPEYFTVSRLESLIRSGSFVVNVAKYFEGKLGPSDAVNTRDQLVASEQKMSPEKSKESIYQEISAAQDAVQSLGRHKSS